MIQVKIEEAVKEIKISAPGGVKHIQHNTYQQQVLVEDSALLPDNIYHIKQGDKTQMCSVIKGRLRTSWPIDTGQPIFLLCGSDRHQK